MDTIIFNIKTDPNILKKWQGEFNTPSKRQKRAKEFFFSSSSDPKCRKQMKLHRFSLRFQILNETLLKCWLMTRDIRRLGGGRFIHLVKISAFHHSYFWGSRICFWFWNFWRHCIYHLWISYMMFCLRFMCFLYLYHDNR